MFQDGFDFLEPEEPSKLPYYIDRNLNKPVDFRLKGVSQKQRSALILKRNTVVVKNITPSLASTSVSSFFLIFRF